MRQWLGRADVRRVLAYVGVALMVAVVTGPSGAQNREFDGIRESLIAPRVILFIVLGVAFGLAVTYAGSARRLTEPVTSRVSTLRRQARRHKQIRWAAYAALVVFIIFYPMNVSNFWKTVLVSQIGIYVLLALGLNVVVGLAGLLDLGYIAFFAIGAYTTAYWTGKLPVEPPFILNPFFVLPIAVAVAMLAGVLLGAPTLRLRGDYLAIVTLGFGEIVRIVAVNSDSLTNGPTGAFGVPHFSVHILGFDYDWTLAPLPYYYLILVVVALVVFFFRRLEDSRIGRFWTAIREDEVAAAATGIPTLRYKLLAFSIGASTSGFAGVIFAANVGSFTPDNFLLLNSILVLTMVIFGGMGSIPGVILGATILWWLPNLLRDYVPPADRYIYFGGLLIVMMIFRPQGLIPSRRRARELELSEQGISGADSLGAPT